MRKFFQSVLFYLLIVGVKGYCCAWLHSVTHARNDAHTHEHTLGRTPLDERSARCRDRSVD